MILFFFSFQKLNHALSLPLEILVSAVSGSPILQEYRDVCFQQYLDSRHQYHQQLGLLLLFFFFVNPIISYNPYMMIQIQMFLICSIEQQYHLPISLKSKLFSFNYYPFSNFSNSINGSSQILFFTNAYEVPHIYTNPRIFEN